MALKAGTVADIAGSMALAMENAMEALWQAEKGEPLPEAGSEDRRLLFAAIAQGVVRHLADNPDAFDVEVDTGTTTYSGEVVQVQTTGTLYS